MELTQEQFNKIKSSIDSARFDRLEAYYLGKHDLLNRKKDADLSNNKVVVNHAKYITDMNIGYLLGNPIQYQSNEDTKKSLESLTDVYNKQTIDRTDTAIAKSLSIYGLAYEYIYTTVNKECGIDVKSTVIDPRRAYIKYNETVEQQPLYGVFWTGNLSTENNKTKEIVIVCDESNINTYVYNGTSLELDTKRSAKHLFREVPLIKYVNNDNEQGDFEQVTSIIDAINVLQSDRINDKEQLVQSILLIKSGTIDDDGIQSVKKHRVMMLPEGAGAEYLTKMLDEGGAETLKKSLVEDLHKISMTPNMSDQNFIGNSSGVAIEYKLIAFEQNVKNKERFMTIGLDKRVELYSNVLNARSVMSKQLTANDVDIIFKRNLPQNIMEIAQIVSLLQNTVDTETLLSLLPFIKDVKGVMDAVNKQKEDSMKMFSFEQNTAFNKVNDDGKEQ